MALKGTGQFAQFATIYTGSSLDIHNTSSTSEFSTGDEILIYDSSLGENRKILRGNFFNGLEGEYISIHGTVEETTPTTNMELLIYDPSVPANRRMTRANFLDGISAVGAFTDLTDTPASYEGYDETYYVRVNAASNALEFATIPSGSGGFSTLVQRSLEGVVYETTLMFWIAPASCTIDSCSMSLSSNPSATGSYCKVQVMKNGTLETNSIFTADTPMQITELTSASNGIYTASGTLDSGQTTLASGDVIQFRVNQADTGSADLLIQMKVTFT